MEYEYAIKVELGTIDIEDVPILFRSLVEELIGGRYIDLLNYAKSLKWSEIKHKRNSLEQEGLPFKDSVLDYDIVSIIRLMQAKEGFSESISKGEISEGQAVIDWTMQDNTVKTLSFSDLKEIPLIAINYSNILHKKSRELRSLIESSTSVEQVMNISW